MVVDSMDRGRRGCNRPAPATVFDPASGYLYLVYFIEPPTGSGIFFAHSMDRGELFHAPVPVAYGRTPSAAGVAGRGDSVVVVFEDPILSSNRPQLAIQNRGGKLVTVAPKQAANAKPELPMRGYDKR
mgnify:CR=1 FL=1